MRCVLVGPVYPYRGGIAHYTTLLCQAIRERGHQILLLSFKRQYPKWLFPGKSDTDPSEVPLEVEDAKYWIDSLNPITWFAALWRIHQYHPNVVILQWWTTFWAPVWFVFGVLIRFLLQRPLVYICHNVLPHETHWWDALLAKAVLRWGNRFVVQSREEEQTLLALLPGARATISPLPLFDMFADGRISRVEARERLDLPQDVPVMLFFGIIREYKGLKDVMRVLPEVRERLGNVRLVVAGEFWENKQSYLDMIRRLELDGLVLIDDRYIPNEQVGVYLAAADVLVAPYRRVTGSAVVQVALAHKCPVIATAIGGLVGTIRDGKEGLLVPPSDARALADSIVRYFAEGMAEPMRQCIQEERYETSWLSLLETIEETGTVVSPAASSEV
jgi:glycosyltransferase involved in cell wall biosynthesis